MIGKIIVINHYIYIVSVLLHTVNVTPPKVQLKTPVMSDEGLSINWNFSENASPFVNCILLQCSISRQSLV